jgi:hypothetical protein
VANEILESADVVGQFLGERSRLTRQTGKALSQCVVEALDVIGFSGLLRDGLVPGEAEAHRAADPAQGNALASQALNECACSSAMRRHSMQATNWRLQALH